MTGNNLLKRVNSSLSDQQFHLGLTPNNCEGMFIAASCDPDMWCVVSGNAQQCLSQRARSQMSIDATSVKT